MFSYVYLENTYSLRKFPQEFSIPPLYSLSHKFKCCPQSYWKIGGRGHNCIWTEKNTVTPLKIWLFFLPLKKTFVIPSYLIFLELLFSESFCKPCALFLPLWWVWEIVREFFRSMPSASFLKGLSWITVKEK